MFRQLIRCTHSWIKPEGYDTGIRVYNCIAKDKVPLIVQNKDNVGFYSCGPTVYDSSHIGHASYFVKIDLIQRILKNYFKLNLTTVINITDVDDKLINRSRLKRQTVEEIAKYYEKEFKEDLNALGVRQPDIFLRVTENIDLIIKSIENLMGKGYAYPGKDGSIYFDLTQYKNYGKLKPYNDENQEKTENKRSPGDFVLWKPQKTADEISWDSPWGRGRPGWHIECTALASHIFGPSLDLHAGGIDLLFPHHENEETQSCCLHDKPQWVNYWLHTGFLHLKNAEKMSKSKNNFLTIKDMLETVDRNVFRMVCCMSHYRTNLEFGDDFVETAENNLKNYKNFIGRCNDFRNGHLKASLNPDIIRQLLGESQEEIHRSLIDDFNTPNLIKTLNKIITTGNSMLYSTTGTSPKSGDISFIIAMKNYLIQHLELLGFDMDTRIKSENQSENLEIMEILNNFRQEIRIIGMESKNNRILKLCDSVRNDLKIHGISVKDHGKKSTWNR